jgi:uncharacterized protein (DUF488 family)
VEIATIGFTRTSAESFFECVKASGIRTLADVRVHNTSQLAAFAKRDDLRYFLRTICDVEYVELPELATSDWLLAAYRAKEMDWDAYAEAYVSLLKERAVESTLDQQLFADGIILLCSEDKPAKCHRRLAAEYLQSHWPNVTIRHLEPGGCESSSLT